ncbi:MAG: hydroxymethylbilane synthase [Nakamurella sp.]
MTPRVLRVGTRGSALALAQSTQVAAAVAAAAGCEYALVPIRTEGDVNRAPLVAIGGTGVFVAAVRDALSAGKVDLVVHSFKDLPTQSAPGLRLGAVPARENTSDALCSHGIELDRLRPGARVGTGSPRRAGQLLRLRPDICVVPIRGNVDTRLARVAPDDLDAVLLATAGLRRLGKEAAITQQLTAPQFLPAPAQGALSVECRADVDDALASALGTLDDPAARRTALAERAVLRELEAGCSAPVSALGLLHPETGILTLVARITTPDGTGEITVQATGPADDDPGAEAIGTAAARDLLARGAGRLVDALGSSAGSGR